VNDIAALKALLLGAITMTIFNMLGSLFIGALGVSCLVQAKKFPNAGWVFFVGVLLVVTALILLFN
jgi:uncharacterized membrane protein HdeD (DUF308 family)